MYYDGCDRLDQEYYVTANSFVRLALGGLKPAYSVVVGIDREQSLVRDAYGG